MKQLTSGQRYLIEAYLKVGKTVNFIAQEINVHRSTVYREILRNKNKRAVYSAKLAQELSQERKERFVTNRTFTSECEAKVLKMLKEYWSPQQIKGYCTRSNIQMVSHERIYQYIRKDKSQGGQLFTLLRHKLKHRKLRVSKHFSIAKRLFIEQRPKIVDLKLRYGDWEMDTIIGANQKGAILTLTERRTNFIFIKKLEHGKNAIKLGQCLIDLMLPYKNQVLTITTDNGSEFADHLRVKQKLGVPIYFTHPYCSWEKGAIENANKLIRQFVKKGSNLNDYTQEELTKIQHIINSRPRKKLNFDTPKNLFYKFVNANVAFDS